MNNFENNLEILSNILQIKSYEILVNDFNNRAKRKNIKYEERRALIGYRRLY